MAKQTVNIGVTANDNTGDPLRTAFDKLNDNFDEVYAAGPVGTNIQVSDNTIASTNTNGNIDLDPAGTGKVLINGPMDTNGIVTLNSTVTGNITPTANVTYNIGSDTSAYDEIHGNVLHVGSLILREVNTQLEIFRGDDSTNAILSGNSTTSGSVLNNGNTVVALTQDGPITFFANNYQDGNATVTVINSGNITTPAVVSTGNVSGGNVIATSLVQGATITATGNITGGNLVTGGLVDATGSITAGTTVTATGNVSGGNLTTAGDVTTATVTASGAVTATGNVDGANLNTSGLVSATGNVSGGNLTTAGDVTTATVTASGDITANNATVTNDTQTATVTFSGDSTEQSTAYIPSVFFLTADESAIQATATNSFGVSADLSASSYYEVMAHLILENDSTGNLVLDLEETTGDATELFVQMNAQEVSGGFADSKQFTTGDLSKTTTMNGTTTYHVQFTGTLKTVSATQFNFKVSTTTGNVTPKAGSSFRFVKYSSNSIGDIS